MQVLSVVLVSLAYVAPAAAQEHQQFRVATFNVRHVTSSDTGSHAWSNREAGVLAAIESNDADVFGLQEASNAVIQDAVEDRFGDDYDHHRPSGGSPKLIYFRRARFERLEPNEEGNIRLPNPYAESEHCHSNANGRTTAWIKLRDVRSGRVYMFVNTHTAHEVRCWQARNESAVRIHELLAEHVSPELTFVLFGDYNIDEQRATGADSRDQMLTLLEESQPGYRLRRSARYTGDTSASDRTFNSAWKSPSTSYRRLDHIFVSASDATTYRQAVDRRTINTLLGRGANISPSDHYLVRAHIGQAPFAFNSVLSEWDADGTEHVSFGDVNGDGADDLMMWKSTVDSGRVQVHLADGAGGFASGAIADAATGQAGEWRFFADIDGDGCADRISWSASIDGGALRVAASTCDGGFAPTESASPGTSVGNTRWRFGRLNDDACMDRVAWNAGENGGRTRSALALCDGTLGFTAEQVNDDAGRSSESNAQLALADVNADGLDDKIMSHPDEASGRSRIYLANGDGSFEFLEESSAGPSGSTDTRFYYADVDGDGSAEKLFWRPNYRQGRIQLYPGDGEGFNGHPAMINSGPSTATTTSFYLADVNGDGSADLVRYNSARPGEVRAYLALVAAPPPVVPPDGDAGGLADAGHDAGADFDGGAGFDGGPGLDAAADAGTPPSVGGGCSCEVSGESPRPLSAAWLLALSLAFVRRRRWRSYVIGSAAVVMLTVGCGNTELGTGDAAVDAMSSYDAIPTDATPADSMEQRDSAPAWPDGSTTDVGALDVGALDVGVPDVSLPPDVPAPDFRPEAEMTYMTANIGRNYSERSRVAAVIDALGDFVGPRTGPGFIGWQEIGEGDPCGGCEWDVIQGRFSGGWSNRRPSGRRPDGASERVKVPVSAQNVSDVSARAAFASPGWAGVSPTRFVTVVYYAERNVSVVNTHLIAGAWSGGSNETRRREYWRQAWNVLRDEVAAEHRRGRNVIVTGDLNRARTASANNPSWDPTSLHGDARIIGGSGIDYVFAVPASGWRFVFARNGDGEIKRGSRTIGIDGHRAHWVAGSFRR